MAEYHVGVGIAGIYAGTINKKGTCLKNVHGAVVDIRGDNKDECLLFRRGKALGRRQK